MHHSAARFVALLTAPLIALLAVTAAFTSPSAAADDKTFLLGGIQINEADQAAWCESLVAAGYNTLHVTTYAIQGDWDSDDLHVDPVDEGTLHKIRAARAAGLNVALILRLHTDHGYERNRFLWHGLVWPRNEATLDAWFAKYRAYILQWAEVAQAEGVTLLGIGSELNALVATVPVKKIPGLENYYLDHKQQSKATDDIVEASRRIPAEFVRAPGDASPSDNLRAFAGQKADHLARWAAATSFLDAGSKRDRVKRINARRALQLEHWRRLIRDVRGVYEGHLTYAANFDSYLDVAFWPELDVMGINAYFPLREASEPADQRTLVRGWEKVWDEIQGVQSKLGVPSMPVVFTELGYNRRANCTVAPWAWEGFDLIGKEQALMVWETQPEAPEERALAMAALQEVNRRRGGPLHGLLYWKLTTVQHHFELEAFALKVHPRDDPRADPLQKTLLGFLRP